MLVKSDVTEVAWSWKGVVKTMLSNHGRSFTVDLHGGHYEYNAIDRPSWKRARKELSIMLEVAGVTNSDDPITKVKKILDFTRQIMPKNGVKGRCDLVSYIAAALLDLVGIESAMGTVKQRQTANGQLLPRHGLVLIRLDKDLFDKEDIRSYAQFYYRNPRSETWVVLEPQASLERQNAPCVAEFLSPFELVEIEYGETHE